MSWSVSVDYSSILSFFFSRKEQSAAMYFSMCVPRMFSSRRGEVEARFERLQLTVPCQVHLSSDEAAPAFRRGISPANMMKRPIMVRREFALRPRLYKSSPDSTLTFLPRANDTRACPTRTLAIGRLTRIPRRSKVPARSYKKRS